MNSTISNKSLIEVIDNWFKTNESEEVPQYISEIIVKLELSGSFFDMETGNWMIFNLN